MHPLVIFMAIIITIIAVMIKRGEKIKTTLERTKKLLYNRSKRS